jgi:methionine-rich copper-binding protein CopC
MLRSAQRAVGVCVALLLSGCDFGVSFTQNTTVKVDVPSEAPKSFSVGQNVNLADSGSGAPIGQLAGVSITGIEISVSDIQTGNKATSVKGSLVITDPSDATFVPITLTFPEMPVADGSSVTLTPTAGENAEIQAAALARQTVHIEYNTTVNALPANFTLTASIEVNAQVAL